jgi:hypothetical protein
MGCAPGAAAAVGWTSREVSRRRRRAAGDAGRRPYCPERTTYRRSPAETPGRVQVQPPVQQFLRLGIGERCRSGRGLASSVSGMTIGAF